jgi:hypothetical protein
VQDGWSSGSPRPQLVLENSSGKVAAIVYGKCEYCPDYSVYAAKDLNEKEVLKVRGTEVKICLAP